MKYLYMCDCELCNDCVHYELSSFRDNILLNETSDSANTSVWSVNSHDSANTSVWSSDSSFSSVSSLSDFSNVDTSVSDVTVCNLSNDSISDMSVVNGTSKLLDVGSNDESVCVELGASELDDFYNCMFEDVHFDVEECFYQGYERVDDVFEDEMYVYNGDIRF